MHCHLLTAAPLLMAVSLAQAAEVPGQPVRDRRAAADAALTAASEAWRAGDHGTVQARLSELVGDAGLPPHYRSYAHLRVAQSYRAAGDATAARREYQAIAAQPLYPAVHRYEAEELVRELDRLAQGLPARDPAASRTPIPPVPAFAAEVVVAPDGNDAGDGSPGHPFRTLSRARDAVRALKAAGTKGAIGVRVRPGEYPLSETLALTAADSGTADAPVVYRSEALGQAVLYGGRRVGGFLPVTDPAVLARLPEEARGKVWQSDLRAQGIRDYGELRVRGGIGQPPAPPTLELFVNGQPMTLARWPNEGFVGIRELLEPGSRQEGKPSVFGYLDDRHARWAAAKDAWLLGYWHFLWADATIKVGRIDPVAKTVTTAEAYLYGGRGMDNQQGIIYYAFNLLEEIDRPGEWYLDRESGVLYLYPHDDPRQATVEIGMLAGPMLSLNGVSHVRLEGLVFDLARSNGIQIDQSTDCLLAGCTVRRLAGEGVIVNGGARIGLFGCDLHTLGRRGVVLAGGDRRGLLPAGHFVENCRIYFFGRVDRTYTPAVALSGVGMRLSHNLFYHCPTSVMSIGGNDHLIEFNDVHSAVQESDDQGAVDMWGNPTFRGNIFRYNQFRHVGKTGTETSVHGQAGIRFDDAISGQLVYGNLFYRSSNGNFGAVQMNSGRDNLMDNNLFIDNRHGISGGWNPKNQHWVETREGKKAEAYTTDLYRERYPELARMLDDNGVNNVWRNVFYRCGKVVRQPEHMDMLENAVCGDEDPGFVDAGHGDFRLREDAPLFARLAFRPIPIAEIGLYAHPLRATWPVTTSLAAVPDWRTAVVPVKARPHPLPPVRVGRVPTAPVIDGRLAPGEWPVSPVLLKETPSRTAIAGPAAEAWLMHDGAALHVAVRVPVGNAARLPRDGTWGGTDGIEVCLRLASAPGAGRRHPTLILQGFPGGRHQGAANPDEPAVPETAALAGASRFAAAVGTDAWLGEWSIPFAALRLAYAPGTRVQFNIGVRRTAPDEWLALAGAMGQNYLLDNAATIVLE